MTKDDNSETFFTVKPEAVVTLTVIPDGIRLSIGTTDGFTMATLTHAEARRLAFGVLARANPYSTTPKAPTASQAATKATIPGRHP